MPTPSIYRIARPADWKRYLEAGEVVPTPLDRRDGFLHLSPTSEIIETATRYFPDATELVLLQFDPGPLAADLRWESVAARGGVAFPHFYGRLSLDRVTEVRRLHRDNPTDTWVQVENDPT